MDLERNPDTLLYTCVAAICELHDHKMLTDVGRPTADSCAVLLRGLKTMTTFIYHLSYTMFFHSRLLQQHLWQLLQVPRRLSQHVKLGCGSWLMADCHREEAVFIWCVCRQQNNDQQHRNGFPHSEVDKITVCQLPFMIAETFSFYIMSWLTVPSIAWPSILSEYGRASCKWLSTWINLNFQKLAVTHFI